MRLFVTALGFIAVASTLLAQPAASTPNPKLQIGTRARIQFPEASAMSSPEQYALRMRAAEAPEPFDLGGETFEILIPKGYKESVPHGLFVWISPNDKADLPKEWEEVLAAQKLIFIGALNSGNNRRTSDRIRMAIDANHHMRGVCNIDPRRVYVSGHSGGGRVASMLGVTYADMFNGAACFMGVNFYQNTISDQKEVYALRYLPHPEILAEAKTNGHYALITGDKDMNLDNTRTIFEQGFKKEEFKHVELFTIPGQGHGAPEASWLKKVIQFLDRDK